MTSPTKIRSQIAQMVERHLAETGEDWWNAKVPWGRRCPLVNPMCPDDLCVLPANHFGAAEGYHVLGTTSYSEAPKLPLEWMRPDGTSDEELIAEGARLQREMHPELWADE